MQSVGGSLGIRHFVCISSVVLGLLASETQADIGLGSSQSSTLCFLGMRALTTHQDRLLQEEVARRSTQPDVQSLLDYYGFQIDHYKSMGTGALALPVVDLVESGVIDRPQGSSAGLIRSLQTIAPPQNSPLEAQLFALPGGAFLVFIDIQSREPVFAAALIGSDENSPDVYNALQQIFRLNRIPDNAEPIPIERDT